MDKKEIERLEKLTKNDCTFEEYVKAVRLVSLDNCRNDDDREGVESALKDYQEFLPEDYNGGSPVSRSVDWVWLYA